MRKTGQETWLTPSLFVVSLPGRNGLDRLAVLSAWARLDQLGVIFGKTWSPFHNELAAAAVQSGGRRLRKTGEGNERRRE